MVAIHYFIFLFFFFCRSLVCLAVSSISSLEPLFLNQTLISSSQIFELGFFTPYGSSNRYVGIWYKNLTPTRILWVANRAQPLDNNDQLARLTVGDDGNLRLLEGTQNSIWSTNVSAGSNRSIAMLMDTGNLVLKDSENIIWESFHFPTDTILPGMKIEMNVNTGEKRYLTSWKTDTDPSPGNFTVGVTSEIPPQPFTWNGSAPHWRGGQWDKSKFIGIGDVENTYLSGYNVQQDIQQGTTYFSLLTYSTTFFTYMFISPEGSLKWVFWNESDRKWLPNWEAPRNLCETYGTCGPFSVCNSSFSPICQCLDGFTPKLEDEWKSGNWTGGCIRKKELECQRDPNSGAPSRSGANQTDYFLKLSQMKLPDTANYVTLIDENAWGCQTWCLNNCSCIAYSYVEDIGCLTWFNEIMDIQSFNMTGKDLFLRLAYSERSDNTGSRTKIITVSLATILGGIILSVAIYYITCRGRVSKCESASTVFQQIGKEENSGVSSELPFFKFKSILDATNNFDIRNKLGQGGFGPVYKGRLQDGREVAVKRLSSSSGQGLQEFKNEIILISKLQHRNLVKLMGCCIKGEERIIVYEYLPNKSLDTFLFDPSRNGELTLAKRIDIIQGIARGLLYLHRDSSLRVIHRDLKASNILLDEKMNPKISDFGLARMFQATQELVNTHRVVGTLGYMAPEYAMVGTFSEKSDVYSFGVLMLEIISSRKNTSLCYRGRTLNLLSFAWFLWREGRELEFIVEEISSGSIDPLQEVTKCVHIGLLCTQDQPMDRPNMPSVVSMLSGESDLPDPRAPTHPSFSGSLDHEIHSQQASALSTTNTMTLTIIEGR